MPKASFAIPFWRFELEVFENHFEIWKITDFWVQIIQDNGDRNWCRLDVFRQNLTWEYRNSSDIVEKQNGDDCSDIIESVAGGFVIDFDGDHYISVIDPGLRSTIDQWRQENLAKINALRAAMLINEEDNLEVSDTYESTFVEIPGGDGQCVRIDFTDLIARQDQGLILKGREESVSKLVHLLDPEGSVYYPSGGSDENQREFIRKLNQAIDDKFHELYGSWLYFSRRNEPEASEELNPGNCIWVPEYWLSSRSIYLEIEFSSEPNNSRENTPRPLFFYPQLRDQESNFVIAAYENLEPIEIGVGYTLNRRKATFKISNVPFESDSFAIIGNDQYYEFVVNQDQDRKPASITDKAYTEQFAGAVPIISNPTDPKNGVHEFDSKEREFFIGRDPDSEAGAFLEGKIKRIFFDPNASDTTA